MNPTLTVMIPPCYDAIKEKLMIGREREIQMHSGLFQSVVTLDDLFRDS